MVIHLAGTITATKPTDYAKNKQEKWSHFPDIDETVPPPRVSPAPKAVKNIAGRSWFITLVNTLYLVLLVWLGFRTVQNLP